MIPKDFYVVLVGEQTLPNLLPAMAIEPKALWFVYSEDRFKKQEISWMVRFWRDFWREKYSSPPPEERMKFLQVDPYSPDDVIRRLLQEWEAEGKPVGIVNGTGGTKLMSIGAFEFARKARQPMLYYHTGRVLSLNPEFPIADLRIPTLSPIGLLAAYGKYRDRTVPKPAPNAEQLEASRLLGREPAAATLVTYFVKKSNRNSTVKPPFELQDRQQHATALSLLEKLSGLGLLEITQQKPDISVQVLDEALFGKHALGSWLEIYVADVVRELLSPDKVLASCNLSWERDRATGLPPEGAPKSEVDILAASDNRLYYFSCKCDGQAKNWTLSKELLNIDATARSLGGALARRVLVTNTDLTAKRDVQVKARIMRIELIDRDKLPQLKDHLAALFKHP